MTRDVSATPSEDPHDRRDDALGVPFSTRPTWKDGVKTVQLSGALVAECQARFAEEVRRNDEQHLTTLVLDLRGLTFIDSTGIGMLVATTGWAREKGFDLRIMRGAGQVQRAMELSGIDRALPMIDG